MNTSKKSNINRYIGYLAFLVLGLPSLLTALTGSRFWPFFNYPMYSFDPATFGTNFKIVVTQQSGRQTQLLSYKYLQPTGANGLDQKMLSLMKDPNSKKRLKKALHYFAKNYQQAENKQLTKITLYKKSKKIFNVDLD